MYLVLKGVSNIQLPKEKKERRINSWSTSKRTIKFKLRKYLKSKLTGLGMKTSVSDFRAKEIYGYLYYNHHNLPKA